MECLTTDPCFFASRSPRFVKPLHPVGAKLALKNIGKYGLEFFALTPLFSKNFSQLAIQINRPALFVFCLSRLQSQNTLLEVHPSPCQGADLGESLADLVSKSFRCFQVLR